MGEDVLERPDELEAIHMVAKHEWDRFGATDGAVLT